MRGRLLTVAALVATLSAGVAGCGAHGPGTTSSTRAPVPAGRLPSEISKEVCQDDARQEIASALGVTATVSAPTWNDHVYSCRYSYPTGSMVLSVKELSSWPQTDAYFRMLADQMGKRRGLEELGQQAFQTADGSVVVRKDWKVLTVDIAGLPPMFGVPETSSGAVAVTVGDVILGCWAGD